MSDTLPFPTPAACPQVVRLTSVEMYLAGMVGVMRQVAAVQADCRDQHGILPEDAFKVHILGACGEFAVAKLTGSYFPVTVNTFRAGQDVGDAWQVRTRSEQHYDLIVRESDRDDDRFVLVVGVPPVLTVCGWITGRDAKRDEWKANHGGRGWAWFVPQQALRPMPTKEAKGEAA